MFDDEDVAALFHDFALAYTDGEIEDSSGARLPTAWRAGPEDNAPVSATSDEHSIDLSSFALHRSLAVIPPGQSAAFHELVTPVGVAVSTRAYGAGTWAGLPDQFPLRCLDDNRLLILATSTIPESFNGVVQIDSLAPICS